MAKARKVSKKRRRHLKKNVRWTIAGLLMATAVIIALIPVQNGGVKAYNPDTDGAIKVYSIDEIAKAGGTHVTDWSSYLDSSNDVLKAYPINGYVTVGDYSDVLGDVKEDTLYTLTAVDSVNKISLDGGTTYKAMSAYSTDPNKQLYRICTDNGSLIKNPDSNDAKAEYYLNPDKTNSIVEYNSQGWTSLRLEDEQLG